MMSPSSQSSPSVLIYLLRRDLRIADNPVLHELSKVYGQWQKSSQTKSSFNAQDSFTDREAGIRLNYPDVKQNAPKHFTHLLPLYVFPAQQVEVSGFLDPSETRSPYPEARSQNGGFWRCGPHRAKFLGETVWNLKDNLKKNGSDLVLRAGRVADVTKALLKEFKEKGTEVSAVWMTAEEGVEERREEKEVKRAVQEEGKSFKLWADEKYFVDDRDLPFKDAKQLPDVFTSFRKSVEPLRNRPRQSLPVPKNLPPLPDHIPSQIPPFLIPDTRNETISALLKPLESSPSVMNPPSWPSNVSSAHPYKGGEDAGHDRIKHLITSGSMTTYKSTRNGLLGTDFSTKLAAWLASGCVTARQVHEYLLAFEDGSTELGSKAKGYSRGENAGTTAVRFELLWRDYMRLCTRKFGPQLFRVEGFRMDESTDWKYLSKTDVGKMSSMSKASKDSAATSKPRSELATTVERFLEGRTGTGLIDASMRELFLTGYTSNRARQNVASFLSKHLGIDWRVGAEWYECMLVDYDVSSNWGNWQYVAGVGNDPRTTNGGASAGRVFNPVKQAFDYDDGGAYVRSWIPELRGLSGDNKQALQNVFQAWKTPQAEKERLGLAGLEWVEKPLVRISFGGGGGGGSRGGHSGYRGGNAKGGNTHGHFRGKSKGNSYKNRRLGDVDKANAHTG